MAAGDRVTDTAAMRQDQVALQGGGVFGGDAQAGEFAEAGVDAVNRNVACGGGGDGGGGAFNAGFGGAVERDGQFLAVDAGELLERRMAGGEGQCGQSAPPMMR